MSFKEALYNKDFVVTAELPLTPDSTSETILADASMLRECVDGFLLTDNQYGQPHMSPLAAASILLNGGLSPILQLNCRNRNRIALLGELLGARALGIDSLMLVRGGPLPAGFRPRPKAVKDTDAKDLIVTVKLINEEENADASKNFLIGATATVHDPAPDWQPQELLAKIDTGAQLIVTQICLDTAMLRRYMEHLVLQKIVRRASVIVSIAVVLSPELLLSLRQNRRDAILPDEVIDHIEVASAGSNRVIDFYGELVREIATIPGISGVNFTASGPLDVISKVLRKSGVVQ